MKTKIFMTFFTGILLLIFFTSCEKDTTYNIEKYSCDPDIQKMIQQNLKSYENLSRYEIEKNDYGVKIAIMRTYTPEHKLELWQEKYKELLSSDIIWKNGEKELLQDVYKNLHVTMFMPVPLKIEDILMKDQQIKIVTDLLNKGTEKFHWSEGRLDNLTINLINPIVDNTLSDDYEYNWNWNNDNQQPGGNIGVDPPSATTSDECNCRKTKQRCGGHGMLECAGDCSSPDGCCFFMTCPCDGTCQFKQS